jgi:hypothetical protein
LAPHRGFKGYTSFVVQDPMIRVHVVNFRCERWKTPDGDVMTAPIPAGINGHFGPELRRFVLAQYHQGQMTASARKPSWLPISRRPTWRFEMKMPRLRSSVTSRGLMLFGGCGG